MSKGAAALAVSLAAVLAYSAPIHSDDNDEVTDAQQRLQQADTQLNQDYHSVMSTLDPAGQASLKTVQRAWVAFKEADFGVFARLAQAAGRNVSIYNYESQEEIEQTGALDSLGKADNNGEGGSFDQKPVTNSQQADQMLNSVYRQLIQSLPPDSALSEKSAEASWIRFRDLYCQLDATLKGGNADDAVLLDLTLRRAEQLGQYMTVVLAAQLPVPDSSAGPGDDTSNVQSDSPVSDPFRFAK